MKVLHVSESLKNRGGTENYIRWLFEAQRSRKGEVWLLRGDVENPERFAEERVTNAFAGLTPLRREASDLCRNRGIDVIHLHQSNRLSVALEALSGIPNTRLVVTLYGHQFYCPSGVKYGLKTRWICNLKPGLSCIRHALRDRCMSLRPANLLRQANELRLITERRDGVWRWIVPSHYVRGELERNGFDMDRVRLLPFTCSRNTGQREPRMPSGGQLLFVGRIVREKGLGDLILALKKTRSRCELKVVGDGPEREAVQSLVTREGLNDRVTFTGWLTESALDDAYAGADCLVVPSVWPEPFGIVGLEAMTRAIPVIAYASGGIPDWLSDQVNGAWVPSSDVSALAKAVDDLMLDSDKAFRMGKAGRELFEQKFSPEKHLNHLDQIYNEANDLRRIQG